MWFAAFQDIQPPGLCSRLWCRSQQLLAAPFRAPHDSRRCFLWPKKFESIPGFCCTGELWDPGSMCWLRRGCRRGFFCEALHLQYVQQGLESGPISSWAMLSAAACVARISRTHSCCSQATVRQQRCRGNGWQLRIIVHEQLTPSVWLASWWSKSRVSVEPVVLTTLGLDAWQLAQEQLQKEPIMS